MIKISSEGTASCRVFLNGELFIDETLPFKNCMLKWSANQSITKIYVINTGQHKLVANGVKIRPGHGMTV